MSDLVYARSLYSSDFDWFVSAPYQFLTMSVVPCVSSFSSFLGSLLDSSLCLYADVVEAGPSLGESPIVGFFLHFVI